MAILSRNQQMFAAELARRTGLDKRLVGAWIIAEEPAGASAPVGHTGDQNWLNIGNTDSKWFGGASAWKDPIGAARASAAWLQGRQAVPGFGRAAPGIVAFSRTAGQPLPKQIAALQRSGWASSGYPDLPGLVSQVSGKLGIPDVGASASGPASFRTVRQRRDVVDQGAFEQAARRYALGQLLENAPRSPFDIGPRASIPTTNTLLAVLPKSAPATADFMRTVTTLRRVPNAAASQPGQGLARLPRGGGYAGTEAIVKKLVDPIAAKAGIKASNYKRTPADNAAVGGSATSDHLTTNRRSYAADYPTTSGEQLAHRLARAVGIKDFSTGNFTHYDVKIGGRQFRVQILWNVEGHHDHVHFGLEAI